MASAWGSSWGSSWGNSWGSIATPATVGTGGWGAGGIVGYTGQPQRIRLLSELDEPVFTPEEVLEAPPAVRLDPETVRGIEAAVLDAFSGIGDQAARHEHEVRLRRERQDEEDEFMMM